VSRVSSRERMLAVLRYEKPDHVPLLFNAFGFVPPSGKPWTSKADEARFWLSLGVDAWLGISPPVSFHPDVTVREWEEIIPGERWPLMVKEYSTPAGPLRQEVYRTEDWVSPDWPGHKDGDPHISLIDDFNVARSRRFLIETEADLAKVPYLLYPPAGEAAARWREEAAAAARQARELGLLLVGSGPAGGDLATWLCGVNGMLLMAMDQPDLFGALMNVIQAWDRRQVELLLDTDVDFIIRRGYYEGTTFWSPALYRRYYAPRITELAGMVHAGNRLIGYTMSVGYLPLLDTLGGLGYDAHYLLDPVMSGGRADLRRVKATFDGKVAVIGGLNEHITLERGSREEIRREVFDAVHILGSGGGLALTPAEGIFASTPWESIETLIEAWLEVRDY
jgi:hypothetical protein